jgi:DNA-binding GntR family transcriptional regulator
LVAAVYATILDAICNGTLPPGTRLGQEWLAERFGVSRQPVAQALVLMKSQGFVTDVGRRGLMVNSLTSDYVTSMYEVRGALDALAAKLAAVNCRSAEQRASAVAAFDRLFGAGEAAIESKSVTDLIAADVAFHSYIYRLSENSVISETMELLWSRMRWVMSAYLREHDWAKRTWGEHRRIVESIVAGDPVAAATAVEAHLVNAIGLIEGSIGDGMARRGASQLRSPITLKGGRELSRQPGNQEIER